MVLSREGRGERRKNGLGIALRLRGKRRDNRPKRRKKECWLAGFMSHREAGHNNSERQRDGEGFLGRESVICNGRAGGEEWSDGVDAAGSLGFPCLSLPGRSEAARER